MGWDIVLGFKSIKQGLGDFFIWPPPQNLYLFNRGFQTSNADPEPAERNLGDILVGHNSFSTS